MSSVDTAPKRSARRAAAGIRAGEAGETTGRQSCLGLEHYLGSLDIFSFSNQLANPLSGFQVFGKLGLARVEFDVDIDTQNFGSASESYDDVGLTFGIGGSFNFNETTAIVLEYVVLPDVDIEGTDVETDAITVGLLISI